MAFDWTSVALGLAGAALPLLAVCWQLQRRLNVRMAGWELLEERLATAQLAQEGLAVQLDASRDEISDLSQANAAKQADLAAVRREVELLQIDRDNARDAAHAWNLERSANRSQPALRAFRRRWICQHRTIRGNAAAARPSATLVQSKAIAIPAITVKEEG